MSEWETFCDISYYHLWRVRRKDERGFNDGYHLQHGEEAKALVELLNRLERERDELQKAVNGLCDHLGVSPANTTLLAVEILKIKRERDEARQQLRIAVGLFSILSQFANKYSEDVLDFVKDDTKCLVCTPAEKCWECADDTSLKEGAK